MASKGDGQQPSGIFARPPVQDNQVTDKACAVPLSIIATSISLCRDTAYAIRYRDCLILQRACSSTSISGHLLFNMERRTNTLLE